MSSHPASSDETRTRRANKGEERRAAILDAVERLLEDRTLDEINISDISRAAGVTRSGFYFYFDNKAKAVAALSRTVYGEMQEGARGYLAREGSPREMIDGLITEVIGTWERHPNLYRALRDARDSDPTVREMWDHDRFSFVDPVVSVIDAERTSGRAADGPDSRALAVVLLDMNDRAVESLSRGGPEALTPETAREALVAVWLNSIYGSKL
ncbi:TetR/AcrR family transcriptional regulator [Prescottella equi]|uniref:TetR/AcrR family transcriptional regulator n=1 Tax=Rhodococcus hoagii TaxID=43767 RepID=UPI000A101417|nr:TetR/AcrR family transcriptional regulator [Prescottella equi]ORM02088.1 TetR family transcriptional regulator [Prescottella equi]ORM20219.1 TetR family transcriptional regulator [Prescottella equi]QDP11472.1 TetR/AcrR family transcriptional regulator [Prescottella equi]